MTALFPSLIAGARIGVFAPSSAFDLQRLEAGIDLVSSWGYTLVRAPSLLARHRTFAGTDSQRLADLRWALESPELDACWMARGGYGLTRLLDDVDWGNVVPRPVIGFSDGTALHVALRQEAGVAGIHGPVLHSLADQVDAPSRADLERLLRGSFSREFQGISTVPGEARGPVVGGNLCMLTTLCGTRWQLDARGCLLLLEDVGEPPYKVDRMLRQLKMAGVLEGVAGVLVGSLLGADAPVDADWSLSDILMDHLGDRGVPLLRGLPVGHGPENRPFVMGEMGEIRGEVLSLGGNHLDAEAGAK